MFEKKDINKYFWLLTIILLSGILIIASDNVLYNILSILVLVFGAMVIVSFDLAHPFVWFSSIFTLYSISYPLFYMFRLTYDINTYSNNLMFTQWLALSTLLLTIGPFKINYELLEELKVKIISNKIMMSLISIILFITIINISSGGYTHKNQIYERGFSLVTLGFSLVLIFLVCFTINLTQTALIKRKLDIKSIFFVFIIIFLLVFFSGERDFLLRFFVIVFFVFYIIIKKSKLSKEIVTLSILGFSSIPILKEFKYFGLTGERDTSDLNIFFDFLNSDFISASKNLQILLADSDAHSKFNGRTVISDFIRAFNLENFIDYDVVSSIEWFNSHYFKIGRSGQGFTLVGEGYINFGYLGIVLVFLIVGLIIKFLYYKSNKNIYYFSFYIISIPIFMYSIRADLANILSPLVNQILLVFLILKLTNKVLSKKSMGKLLRSVEHLNN